jgi:hypothetical protein
MLQVELQVEANGGATQPSRSYLALSMGEKLANYYKLILVLVSAFM